MHISKRASLLPISSVRRLTPYAQVAKEKNVKIYHLNIGDPDIKTPSVLLKVLKNWNINPIRYAHSSGEPDFLNALVTYYNNLRFTKINRDQIVATVGGSEAISMTLFTVCDPLDEVLVFEPFYSNYSAFATINSVTFLPVATSSSTGFHLPGEKEIEQKITKKTKAILYCSPNNPTGTIYTRKEIEMLVKIAKKYNLFLIADEVYREYVFGNNKAVSLLEYFRTIPNLAIIVDSLSKRYSLCGARLGSVISYNKEVIQAVNKMAQARLSGGLIEQIMTSKINKVPKSYIQNVRKEYQKRRDVLYSELLKIPGVSLRQPEGAFYTMVSLPVKNAEDFCIYLLKEFRLNNATVMLAPGNGFYLTSGKGEQEVRIAYVLNTKDLKMAIKILKTALKEYQGLSK